MFEEATERRQQLKSLQEQISNSLQEEACETLAELEAVIAQKKKDLLQWKLLIRKVPVKTDQSAS